MVSNFTSSDRSFLQYRCFLELHSRVVLDLQYDIQLLEKELDELDRWDSRCTDKKMRKCLTCNQHDRNRDVDKMPEEWKEYPYFRFTRTRPEVLAELRIKLLEYGRGIAEQTANKAETMSDEMLLKTKEMNSLQRPSKRDYRSVVNWFDSHKPLVTGEAAYIQRKEDIVTLRSGREGTGFDGLIERGLSGLDNFFTKRCKWSNNIVKVSS
jgi:hypothetical protein